MDTNEHFKIFKDLIEKKDFEGFKLLLNDSIFNPTAFSNFFIINASQLGSFEIVELLLNDNRVNPSDRCNLAITFASEEKHLNIVNLLWQDQRVKNTLKNDNIDLYNELIKKDKLKQKVEVF